MRVPRVKFREEIFKSLLLRFVEANQHLHKQRVPHHLNAAPLFVSEKIYVFIIVSVVDQRIFILPELLLQALQLRFQRTRCRNLVLCFL